MKYNFYLRDTLQHIKYYKHNVEYDHIVEIGESIDSIADYNHFKDYIIRNLKLRNLEKGIYLRKELFAEGLLYGHRKAFVRYAGNKNIDERFIFPYFEHGADLREVINPEMFEPWIHSYVLQSDYKNKWIHNKKHLAPVYNIGPYILYAKPYYEENKLVTIREKYGRTLLLFPAHTFEGASVEYNKRKFVSDVMGQFKSRFDTILVCVYWNDVDDPIYDIFQSEGAILVSAGFRGDEQFISRLRTLIDLSDVVASNLIGSYIGYSQALNKPLYLFQDKAVLTSASHKLSRNNEKKYLNTIETVFDAFSTLTPSKEQIDKQKQIVDRYWGRSSFFKTKDEASRIVDMQIKLVRKSKGSIDRFEKEVKRVVEGRTDLELTNDQIIILQDALGGQK